MARRVVREPLARREAASGASGIRPKLGSPRTSDATGDTATTARIAAPSARAATGAEAATGAGEAARVDAPAVATSASATAAIASHLALPTELEPLKPTRALLVGREHWPDRGPRQGRDPGRGPSLETRSRQTARGRVPSVPSRDRDEPREERTHE
ncbi:MAG: hypothetical protein H6745_08885 [Deltaproteobacteria bacterium]|nr:hypothetical protein [Deltaproteobacteria bacterium]